MASSRWKLLLAVTALGLAVLMQIPQIRYQMDPRSQGVLVKLNSDEDAYLSHVEEALNGRPSQSAESFIGDPTLVGSQFAFLEEIIGTTFRVTGLRASEVMQILDSIVTPLIFLLLVLFWQLGGFSRKTSYLGALGFVFLLLHTLNRPVQPAGTFLLLLLALVCIIQGLEKRMIFGVLGGFLLGMLVGMYFWSWTFGWAWCGLLFFYELWQWHKTRYAPVRKDRVLRLCLFGAVACVTALPFFLSLSQVVHNELYPFVLFRSELHLSHLPESWPYTIVFTLMLIGVIGAFRTSQHYRYPMLTLITAFVVLHQQVLHGKVLLFVSHYLMWLVFAALGTFLLACAVRSRWMILCGIGSIIYLGAIGYDGRAVFTQWSVRASEFSEQHLAAALPVLDGLDRVRILSDPETSGFIAANTKHDIVYSIYLQYVLMTHQEIAERYCLTQLPRPAAARAIAAQPWLIYPGADRIFASDPSVRAKEVALVMKACAAEDRNPAKYLKTYGVQYVLWNSAQHPDWRLSALAIPLTKTASGSGWSLWKLR